MSPKSVLVQSLLLKRWRRNVSQRLFQNWTDRLQSMRNRLRISKLRNRNSKGDARSWRNWWRRKDQVTLQVLVVVLSPSQGTTVHDRWSPVFHPVPVVVLEPLEAMQAEQGITAQTPCSKTNQLIRDSGLTPRKVPAGIKKTLIYANVVEDELQIAAKKSDQHKEVVVSLLNGKQLKRYRMKKHLSQQLNVSEKFLSTRKDKSLKCLERRRLLARQKELKRQVRSFLERDDNSRMNPGKQDCLTVDGEQVQTRILNDYLYILYEKFIAENPQVKRSKSSFYKLRPKHIRHSNCLKPNNCLC